MIEREKDRETQIDREMKGERDRTVEAEDECVERGLSVGRERVERER